MTPSETSVPYGYCHCRCGQKTNIHKGDPRKFVNGHQRKIHPILEDAAPFKIDGVYCRIIHLSQGNWTIVDASDYEWLMEYKWTLRKYKKRHCLYAFRMDWTDMKHPRSIFMHRAILKPSGDKEADHENGNGLDNRRKNLREGNPSQQRQNTKLYESNTSGHKGVCYDKTTKSWKTRIKVNGKEIWLGRHSKSKAVAIRREAEKMYFGEWSRENQWKK